MCLLPVVFLIGALAVPALAAEETGGPVPPEPVIEPPHVILASQRPPVYPPAALAGRFGGVVHLRVTVRTDGKVGDVAVVDCDHPNLGFEKAAIDAVREWRFDPALRDGAPVEHATTLRLNFRVTAPGAKPQGYVSVGGSGPQKGEDHDDSRAVGTVATPAAPKR